MNAKFERLKKNIQSEEYTIMEKPVLFHHGKTPNGLEALADTLGVKNNVRSVMKLA